MTGYLYVFDALTALFALALVAPLLVCVYSPLSLVAAILRLIGSVISIREAAELTTGKAIVLPHQSGRFDALNVRFINHDGQ